jgi:murein L,D-transpeptidase YafK
MTRRGLAACAGIAAISVLCLFAYDFLKLGRVPPALKLADERADLIRIDKAARRMDVLRGDRVLKTYRISLGGNPAGDKVMEGDRRTPEGLYRLDFRNAASRFHLALRISYPDATDRADAERLGAKPGGDIMIHGIRNGLGFAGGLHHLFDWTDGCIAVTNDEIEEIWQIADVGTAVDIRP